MKARLYRVFATAAVALLFSACGSGQGASERPSTGAPAAFGLPTPASLGFEPVPLRGASYADSDLVQLGAAFRTDLPNSRVTQMAPSVELSPNFALVGTATLDGLAYCLFGFSNLSAYDRDDVVNTKWDDLPADGTCWIGLANWGGNHWDWFALAPDLRAEINVSAGGPLDDYIDFGGGLLLAVVMVGTDPATLRSVRLGTYPPQAVLQASPDQGLAPLDTVLDAGLSTDSDGSIVKYEWDLDGDGSYETDGGAADSLPHTFSGVVSVSVGLRVTDNNGATGTSSAFVSTFAEWNHTWGKAADDQFNAVLVSGGDIFVAGQLDFDQDADIVLQCYSLSGSRLWSKTWDSGDMDIPRALALSEDGKTLFLAGLTMGGSAGLADMLLQAWDLSGNLKWTRTWGGDQSDYGYDLVAAQGGVFLCGTAGSFGNPKSPQAAVLRFDESGVLDWQRSWGGSAYDECFSACLVPTLFGDPTIALAGDTNSFGSGQMDILYLRFDLAGNLTSALTWGDANVQTATGIASSLLKGTYVCGWETVPEPMALALKVSGGNPSFAFSYYSGVGAYFNALAFDNNDLVLAGYANLGANFDLLAGRSPLDGSGFGFAHISKGGGVQLSQCLARLPDGSFVFGGKDDNNTGIDWQSLSATGFDRDGVPWKSVSLEPQVLSVAAGSLSIVPTFGSGTSDTGGGGGDMFIGVHKL